MHGTDLSFEPTQRTFHYVGDDDSRRRVYRPRPSRQVRFRRALAEQTGRRP